LKSLQHVHCMVVCLLSTGAWRLPGSKRWQLASILCQQPAQPAAGRCDTSIWQIAGCIASKIWGIHYAWSVRAMLHGSIGLQSAQPAWHGSCSVSVRAPIAMSSMQPRYLCGRCMQHLSFVREVYATSVRICELSRVYDCLESVPVSCGVCECQHIVVKLHSWCHQGMTL
jgi:hypothetical protein